MKSILILNRSDFNNYYGEELLANLEDCQDIKFDNVLNFSTNVKFEGSSHSRVMEAFNVYLAFLRQTVERIIINL